MTIVTIHKNVSENLSVSPTEGINMKICEYQHKCEYEFNCLSK